MPSLDLHHKNTPFQTRTWEAEEVEGVEVTNKAGNHEINKSVHGNHSHVIFVIQILFR